MPLLSSSSSSSSSSPLNLRSFLPKNPLAKITHLPSNGRLKVKSNSLSLHSRFKTRCSKIGSNSLELPFLPFVSQEVLIPSEAKTLHLYEARYLDLLEEAIAEKNKTFVHFVLDDSFSKNESSSSATYCCLIHIENIEKLKIGALVSIRGIGRVDIVGLVQMEPYLRGVVIPVQDNIVPVQDNNLQLDLKIAKLRDSIASLHSLQMKLKVPKSELLQTQTKSSLIWAESEIKDEFYQNFIPNFAERVSFAAFQPVSGMLGAELETLQREKLQAMELRDVNERLERGINFVNERIKMVAARLAIQSI